MSKKEILFAPRETFKEILKWAVIPTFDLIVLKEKQVIIVKRKIVPYKNQWALPGLRMYKNEDIDSALKRIAKNELGLNVDTKNKVLLGQFVGRFKTENSRQDLSTAYMVEALPNQEIQLNQDHFYSFKLISDVQEIPKNSGTMYRFYLDKYFKKNY